LEILIVYGTAGIGHLVSLDPGESCEGMWLNARGAQDIQHFYATREQCIADEGTVASPGDGLRAHDCRRFMGGGFEEGLKPTSELRSLHVIRITAKRCIPPAAIDGIGPRLA